MADRKVKIAVFGTAIVIAVVLIIGLCVHQSLYRDRICKDRAYLYYEHPDTGTGTCLQAGLQGPCGNNMALVIDRANISKGVGVCECDVNRNERPLIYHPETNQCYFIFTQGFCEEGQWLSVLKTNATKTVVCDTKFCPDSPDGTVEMVPLKDGRCVELGKQETCNRSEVIKFHKGKIFPSCTALGTSIGSVGVPSTDCPAGYFHTGVGLCQPDFDFE